MIEFLRHDGRVSLRDGDVDPNATVLNYLRERGGRTGTKEGCASGDCGACTVVLAELDPEDDGRLRYRAVNSCITLLAALHGKRLISVEDLSADDAPRAASLHPVQRAMVDHHGSQCGFCTPGFVMALFAFAKTPGADAADPRRALAGNLCRCTGYRPILDAARDAAGAGADRFDAGAAATRRGLRELVGRSAPVALRGGARRLFAPTSLDELFALRQQYPDAELYRGGTDLSLRLTQRLETIDTLIYLGRVAELNACRDDGVTLTLGAARPLSDLFAPLVARFPNVAELLTRFGSPQIRNQASVGGSLASASPIGDLSPPLLALGAVFELAAADGRRRVAADDFFIDYRRSALRAGEVIVSVELPLDAARTLHVYKVSKRYDDDISSVCAAFALRVVADGSVADARIAYGGMAAVPRRAPTLEQTLNGSVAAQWPARKTAIRDALDADFTPLSDTRASAAYRRRVAANLVQRLGYQLCRPELALRAVGDG